MAYQSIGRGASANDGTGDDLRTGAGKVNANFVELYTLLGDGSTLTSDTVTLNTATQTLTNKTITGTLTGNVTGNVTGDLTGDVTGNVTGDVTGNADTATALETARTIAGQSFDGTANITIAATDLSDTDQSLATTDDVTFNSVTADLTGDVTGNVTGDVTGNADTATALASAVNIAGQPFDGTASISISASDLSDVNQSLATTDTVTFASVTADLTGDVTGDVTGNLTGNVTGNVDGQVILSEDSQTGDGSTSITIDPTKGVTLLTSSAGGDAATLADGSTVGQTTTIILESDGGGDVVLTPTTFLNGSTITFADAGDQVTLVWTGTNGWAMVGAGYGAPVVA